jgi:hypothetical protein
LDDVADFIDPAAGYDLSPTTDDSPYFFKLDFGTPPAIWQAFVGSIALAALFFTVALAYPVEGPASALRWPVMVVYIALIGLGFLLIEIPLIQRLQLLLGYPILTLSVTLGTILLASGLGSFISQRWEKGSLVGLVEALLPLGMVPRVLAALGLSALIGLPMGIPFPSAIRLAGPPRQRVALIWAVNGAFSVLGSVSAVIISMNGGFSWALLAGAACYLILSGLVWMLFPGGTTPE